MSNTASAWSKIRSDLVARAATLTKREAAVGVHLRGEDGRRELDPEDASTLIGGDEVLEGIEGAALAELAEIRAAIARIDGGTYGTCESCGGDIGEKRLAALPHARFCVSCARSAP